VRSAVSLVRACHPEACAAVTVVAVLLGVAVGRAAGTLALIGAAVLTGQLCVGWLNDVLDAARDSATARRDKPIAAGHVTRRTVAVAAVCAGVACVPLSLTVGPLPGALHLVAVGSALGYDAGLKATALSVLPYLVSFGLLPVFVVLGWTVVPWWLPLAGALLGAAAHFANVLPDLADDAATGVHGLPHRIGATGGRITTVALVLAASVVLAVGPSGLSAVRLGLTGLAVAVLLAGHRRLFHAVLVVALLDVVQLVVAAQFVVAVR
jgi:4-hydroxybenzoate polyprenyltransferase